MKAVQSGAFRVLLASMVLAVPAAQAQLEDLFGDPGAKPFGDQHAPAQERKTGRAKHPTDKTPPPDAAAQAPQAPAVSNAASQKVVIYTTPTCPHCRRALQHMQARNIAFVQKDVKRDPANHAEFKRIGGRGVPHILMGDAVLVGFDPRHFDQQYADWQARNHLPR